MDNIIKTKNSNLMFKITLLFMFIGKYLNIDLKNTLFMYHLWTKNKHFWVMFELIQGWKSVIKNQLSLITKSTVDKFTKQFMNNKLTSNALQGWYLLFTDKTIAYFYTM